MVLLEGKYSRPIADCREVHLRSLTRVAESPCVLIQAAPGYLLSESLAALLDDMERPFVWLRFSEDDFDPARCLSALITALQGRFPDIGKHTLEKIQQPRGPQQDWSVLYASLAAELAEANPDRVVLVLDHLHQLSRFPQAIQNLGRNFVLRLPEHVQVIMTSQANLPRGISRKLPVGITTKKLRLNQNEATSLFQSFGLGLPEADIQQFWEILQGNAGSLVGLCRTGQLLGEAYLHEQIQHGSDAQQLLQQLSQDCVAVLSAEQRLALWILIHLGYYHPLFFTLKSKDTLPPRGPWVQFLEHGWSRSYNIWKKPLQNNLKTSSSPNLGELSRVASQLCEQGSPVEGINIFLNLGLGAEAAQAIEQHLPGLVDQGLWETLAHWFERLPPEMLAGHPRLLQASGEIKASTGSLGPAITDLRLATKSFSQHKDLSGQCTNLLALSALEFQCADYPQAHEYAVKARTLAQKASIERAEGWAEYQLGLLAGRRGDLLGLRNHFKRATDVADRTGDEGLRQLAKPVFDITAELTHFQQTTQNLRSSLSNVEQAQKKQMALLKQTLNQPLIAYKDTHGIQNWLDVPLICKVSNDLNPVQRLKPSRIQTFLKRIQSLLNTIMGDTNPINRNDLEFLIPITSLPNVEGRVIREDDIEVEPAAPLDLESKEPITTDSITGNILSRKMNESFLNISRSELNNSADNLVDKTASSVEITPTMMVHCLGVFRVFINELPVNSWSGHKGKSIFKYLINHREQPTHSEILMTLFWQDADPDSARRNLYQAIYNLRQTLQEFDPEFPFILLKDSSYYVNPAIKLWVDWEAFLDQYQLGQKWEHKGKLIAAVEAYKLAENYYEGEFLAEDRYEDWPIIRRENLRHAYLSILDRLSRYYFDQDEIALCITICQKILKQDICREDAHRRLMRSYMRQGQRHLAIRQYHFCVEALQKELNVRPMPTTAKLYREIQNK